MNLLNVMKLENLLLRKDTPYKSVRRDENAKAQEKKIETTTKK